MEIKTKIESFMEEYGALVKKFNVDFASYPMFVPDEKGSFKVIVQTTPVDLEEMNKEKMLK
jgi:hypothetical protein